MQDSHRQLSIKDNWAIVAVIVFTPLFLYAAIPILPTFDDWMATTRPTFEPLFTKERFLFYGYHWRPFDSITGYIAGLNPQLLFPTFHHCCIVLGHAANSLLVYHILTRLGFDRLATNIATVFFLISPATLATVLAVDSLNQTYALLWGMVSFWAYISLTRRKYVVWTITILIATLCKENGLMWALIGPILAYGFKLTERNALRRDLMIGVGIMLVYALAVLLFPKDIVIHPDYVPSVTKVITNIVKFLFTTFVTIDYVWLLHQPSRNLLMAMLTFLLTLPFIYYVFIRNCKALISRQTVCTMLCLLIAVGPHLLTVFSMMHTYGGLCFVSILIAYAINGRQREARPILLSFLPLLLSAFIINTHLWHRSLQSGLVGKRMAIEAVSKTGQPVDSVYVIIIEDDYPKLSSFCVIPAEAFGWGYATQYYTNYSWPQAIRDTTINRSASSLDIARKLGQGSLAKKQCGCVWIVDHSNIEVLK